MCVVCYRLLLPATTIIYDHCLLLLQLSLHGLTTVASQGVSERVNSDSRVQVNHHQHHEPPTSLLLYPLCHG